MSLFHSVAPDRHGIMTNTYTPQVRPIKGICEVLSTAKKTSGMFYDWEEIRDLTRPGSIDHACFDSGRAYGYDVTNLRLTDTAINYVNSYDPDFVFLYLGLTDEVGHKSGWMSDKYKEAVDISLTCVEKVINSVPDEYTVILTADHGGHGRSHGSDLHEDMTIPVMFYNKDITAGEILSDVNIIDIAPTIVSMLGIAPDTDWDGKIINEVIDI
jgi:phosphopentomutase